MIKKGIREEEKINIYSKRIKEREEGNKIQEDRWDIQQKVKEMRWKR